MYCSLQIQHTSLCTHTNYISFLIDISSIKDTRWDGINSLMLGYLLPAILTLLCIIGCSLIWRLTYTLTHAGPLMGTSPPRGIVQTPGTPRSHPTQSTFWWFNVDSFDVTLDQLYSIRREHFLTPASCLPSINGCFPINLKPSRVHANNRRLVWAYE